MSSRIPNVVTILREHGLIPDGTVLRFNLEEIKNEHNRSRVETWLSENPAWAYAGWMSTHTGSQSVRSVGDGNPYSITNLIETILAKAGVPQNRPNPAGWWTVTTAGEKPRTLWEIAEPHYTDHGKPQG